MDENAEEQHETGWVAPKLTRLHELRDLIEKAAEIIAKKDMEALERLQKVHDVFMAVKHGMEKN